jgi:4-hydroxybutyryl-CoA dehydratase / vinylacetyl-CoA-Delta-isomerase
LVVTAPTYKDWQLPELKGDIDKYLGGKAGIPTEHRLRMFDLIRRITNADLETIALHGEGSPYAERMTIYMEGQKLMADCKKIAEALAQIE